MYFQSVNHGVICQSTPSPQVGQRSAGPPSHNINLPQTEEVAALLQEERYLGEENSPPLDIFAQDCYRMSISFHNVAKPFPFQAGVEAVPSSLLL